MHSPERARFRIIGLLEGASFLLLLFIAMPLKYLADMPLAVKVVGWAHGVLFIGYLLSLGQLALQERWSVLRIAAAVVAGLLPFGPFVLHARMAAEGARAPARNG